jgi:inorganic pyrophosphatase
LPAAVPRHRCIEAREKEVGKRWERNDRLIAVACHARTHEGVQRLRAHTLDDIAGFFEDYNRLHDKRFEVHGRHGPRRANKLVKQAAALYRKKGAKS